MRNQPSIRTTGRRVRRALPVVPAALLAFGLAACDDILSVDDPEKVTPEDVLDPDNLPAVRAYAIGDFQVGYNGNSGSNSFVLMTGMMSDEHQLSGTFPTRLEVDRRQVTISNGTVEGTFRVMHQGRRAAELAAQLFGEHDPGTRPHAEAHNLAGFMTNAFAEMYCSGVPFSSLPLDSPDPVWGEPLTTVQMLERALDWFEGGAQIAAQAGADGDGHAAAVGQGRVLLNLGRFDEAAAAVAAVPTDFAFYSVHDPGTTRQWNGVWGFMNNQRRWRVADQAGGNGLPYRTEGTEVNAAGEVVRAGDPRVTWFAAGVGFDGSTAQFNQRKYPNNAADLPVASGIEARLIEAEAALRAGDQATFLDRHNALRATVGLDPFTAGEIAALGENGVVDLHFKERAFWLWQTGHRLGDMRRLIRQYGRDSESVFPTGSYFKGGTYGTDVNFPIPFDEQNNPNFESCIDRSA